MSVIRGAAVAAMVWSRKTTNAARTTPNIVPNIIEKVYRSGIEVVSGMLMEKRSRLPEHFSRW
jgi:hypothetical protein